MTATPLGPMAPRHRFRSPPLDAGERTVRIHGSVTGTLSRTEFEGLRRSAAMAPLDHQNVIRLIQAYDELLAERDHLVASLRRLMPAWGEVRDELNELSRR
jgi:hypothetical protein